MMCVFGLGGSGKSTLAQMLLAEATAGGSGKDGWSFVAFLHADRLLEDYVDVAVLLGGCKRSDLQEEAYQDVRDRVHRCVFWTLFCASVCKP